MLEPDSVPTEAANRWYDRVRMPQLLEAAGAVGAWTFHSERLHFAGVGPDHPSQWRLQLVYLDEEPLDFVADLAERDRARQGPAVSGDVEQLVFEGPLRTTVPWQWNWFDEPLIR